MDTNLKLERVTSVDYEMYVAEHASVMLLENTIRVRSPLPPELPYSSIETYRFKRSQITAGRRWRLPHFTGIYKFENISWWEDYALIVLTTPIASTQLIMVRKHHLGK